MIARDFRFGSRSPRSGQFYCTWRFLTMLHGSPCASAENGRAISLLSAKESHSRPRRGHPGCSTEVLVFSLNDRLLDDRRITIRRASLAKQGYSCRGPIDSAECEFDWIGVHLVPIIDVATFVDSSISIQDLFVLTLARYSYPVGVF